MVAQSTILSVDGDEYLIIEDPDTGAVIEGYAVEVPR
jgi:hypothetical protein